MAPDEVERIAAQLRAAQAVLEHAQQTARNAASLSLSPFTYGVQPGGLLLAPAAIGGTQVAAAKVHEALSAVDHLISVLALEATQQRAASSASAATGGSAPGKAPLPEPPANGTPEENTRWWASLGDRRQEVIEQNPDAVRNLDGIPARDRIAANKVWAEKHKSDPGLSDGERKYLELVASGDRKLYLYDAANERVIEVVGNITEDTENVVTYVPGTDCSMDSFYDGSVQKFSKGLVDADATGATVVFVYKDGPWADWSPGDRSNANLGYLESKGKELAEFESIISADPDLANKHSAVVAHSAGNTIAAYSEMYGAYYDDYVSLAGSFLPPGWVPKGGTEYDHYQYVVDVINLLDSANIFATPHSNPFFEHHIEGWSPNPLDNHSRIARDGDNRSTINDVFRQIRS